MKIKLQVKQKIKKKIAFRFKVSLTDIEPLIWRLIEVPSTYSFWDLHVAIQDSMGWLDYHLHSFSCWPSKKRNPVLIGIPDEGFDDDLLAGWEIPINQYFKEPGDEAYYEYDFGDGWHHIIALEGIFLQVQDKQYPNCLSGRGACPPEDCRRVPGYYNMLEIISNSGHEEHKDMNHWLENHVKNYYPYQPEKFEPNAVAFSDPKKRWRLAFQ